MLLQEEKPKRTFFIEPPFYSSTLAFLKVQLGSSLIDPVLLQEET